MEDNRFRGKTSRIFNNRFTQLLQSLPFSDETKLETKISELLFNFKTDIRVYFTSGTTQKPKALYFDSKDIENISDYLKWFCEVEGIAGGERVVVLMDHSFWGTGHLTSLGHNAAGNSVIPVDLLSKEGIAEILNAVSPTVISTLPSKLEEYADIIPKDNLKILETTGEIMSKKLRSSLEKKFGAEIYDAYGLTEGVVGVECKKHCGYHYREDKIIVEIKDLNSDKILKDNQIGEVVITNLMCHTQPIIRYKTGDLGKIIRSKCSCGLSEPRLIIKGRVGKTYWLKDGAKITEKSIKNVLDSVLGFIPLFSVRMDINQGKLFLTIDVKIISKIQSKKIINLISESNFDVYNLIKTKQLEIVVKTK